MSLQYAIDLNDLTGIYSSGASPKTCNEQWKTQYPDVANILFGSIASSGSIDVATRFEKYFSLSSHVMSSFYVDMTMWWNTSSFFQHEAPGRSYIDKTDLQKLIDGFYLYTYQETAQYSQKHKLLERLAVIAQREDDWDGYDSKKPTESTINRAKHFIEELLDNDFISARLPQLETFICSDEDGYITFECYNDKRSLCFDIQENETRYTKIWRTSDNTMTQTDSLNREIHLTLWEWFLDE